MPSLVSDSTLRPGAHAVVTRSSARCLSAVSSNERLHLVAPGRVPSARSRRCSASAPVERDPLASGAAVLCPKVDAAACAAAEAPRSSAARRGRAPTARVDLDPLTAARVAAGLRRRRRLRAVPRAWASSRARRQPDPTTGADPAPRVTGASNRSSGDGVLARRPFMDKARRLDAESLPGRCDSHQQAR